MSLIQRLGEKAKENPAKIVFPEGTDHRILHAARQLVDNKIAEVILIGDKEALEQAARNSGVSLAGLELIDSHTSDHLENYSEQYVLNRSRTKVPVAKRLLKKPLNFGAMMVKAGDADLVVAGVNHPTRKVIEAAGVCIGLATPQGVPSSFFIMSFEDKDPLIFADCAVNVNPTAAELANIAIDTGLNAERLFGEPAKIALLSFSTKGHTNHQDAEKVIEALNIARNKNSHLSFDGQLQADTALSASIASAKLADIGEVAGQANVLIFPTLDAGNIGYKLVSLLAGATAIGPILQGFSRPVADLSRGAIVEEIVATTIIALALR